MEFTTIILRFRDLVGKTIEEHQKIISNKGFVWWAWWKKSREKTPVGELAELNEVIKENPLKLLLIDSGNEKLFLATCTEIRWNSINPIDSPHKENTPPYYSENQYHVWFNFSKIEECSEDVVKNYSYVDVSSLFEGNEENYSAFNNKRVFDINELVLQNRTLWFVRDFSDGDKEHKISLFNSHYIEPSNFSDKYIELDGNTILWLSDLHLSNGVLKVDLGEKSFINHIKQTKTDEGNELFPDISAVVISGDITDCCKQEGFEQAKTLIDNLSRESGAVFDNQKIVLCPGNHDLIRIESTPPVDDDGVFLNPDFFWDHPETAELYTAFYKDIFKIKPNKHLSNGRKILTKSGKTIEIVAINTMILQQYEGFEGHGYISQEQLDLVEKEMNWGIPSSAIRIVVMHHHYCPACLFEQMSYEKAGSVVYDADRLLKWSIKNNVKLILHGHKHNDFFAKVSIPTTANQNINLNNLYNIYITSVGGTGAKEAENKYCTMTFYEDELKLRYYRFYPDQITLDKLEKIITIPYGEL